MRGPLILFIAFFAMGCVGPSSPFGGVEFGTGDGIEVQGVDGVRESSDIQFSPRRQMLHQPSRFQVSVPSKVARSQQSQYRMIYNGRDVTHAFAQRFAESENSSEKTTEGLQLTMSQLRLAPNRKHSITFLLRPDPQAPYVKANYLPPQCLWDESREVRSTAPFAVDPHILAQIERQAKKYKVNKSLLTGLIAQESGFSTTAVSSSRGIGLTQITPLAAMEIEKNRIQWKRYEKFDTESPARIKRMIASGEVTERDDWRLNVDQSIEGAAIYLQYLERYWEDKDSRTLLYAHKEIPYVDVILASYNSGAARVKKRIQDNEKEWLDPNSLKEAFRYVNAISSYCYHFAESDRAQ